MSLPAVEDVFNTSHTISLDASRRAGEVELMPKDPVERCFSWRTFMAYCGPGWLMSLAYLDPGNLECRAELHSSAQ